MFYLQIVLTFLWRTPQPVTVQFVPKGVCFLCVVHVLVDVIDLAYFHSAYFYILLPALSFFFFCRFAAGLGSEICQSWPQKSNVSTAAGCIHKTQPRRRHLKGRDISPIYYPSWPKLFLSFTVRVSAAFPITKKTLCWILKGTGEMRKDVDVRRFRSIQSIHFL